MGRGRGAGRGHSGAGSSRRGGRGLGGVAGAAVGGIRKLRKDPEAAAGAGGSGRSWSVLVRQPLPAAHSHPAGSRQRPSQRADPGGFRTQRAPGMAGRGKLIAVMGDEDTVTGFLLGGIGELDKHRRPNFLVVEKETSLAEIEETFRCV